MSINLEPSLSQTYRELTTFAGLDDFWNLFDTAFDVKYNRDVATSLRSQWLSSDFSQIPQIEVLDSTILGNAKGAYSTTTNKIYLSSDFVATSTPEFISTVLTEEIGHFIDAQINQTDTTGDEGAIFAALVNGEDLSSEQLQKIKEENDSGVITVDGQSIQVEQALIDTSQLFNPLLLSLFIPVGIAIDKQGNLIASNRDNSFFTKAQITKISSAGGIVQQTSSGEDQGYLAVIPSSGSILRLQGNGNLSLIDPNNLAEAKILNIKDLNVNASSIFNILPDTTVTILPQAPQTYYGDIAVLERGSQLDVFVSGLSIGLNPFVMRLRFQNNTVDARVVIASVGNTAAGPSRTGGNINLPRGVAVNNQGTVLTTLPINVGLEFYDVPVSFSADFPEKGGTPQIKLKGYTNDGYVSIPSRGMTTDQAGNFYVVTTFMGHLLADVVVLDPDINNVLTTVPTPITSWTTNYRDIAVDSSNKVAYITSSENYITRFNIGNNINTTITLTNVKQNPALYMNQIRDYDGNDLGSGSSWRFVGDVDVQGDGDSESIFVNSSNGRWATVGSINGTVDFSKNGFGGDTRVVGIYIDPTLKNQPQNIGGPFDSQRRFQNDLRINNLSIIAGADYNKDGFQDVYFKVNDGSAVLRGLMHKDGNIQYANYQSKDDLTAFMSANGISSSIWSSWI
jgi:hypothetical protein